MKAAASALVMPEAERDAVGSQRLTIDRLLKKIEHYATERGVELDWGTVRVRGTRSAFDEADESGEVIIPAGTLLLVAEVGLRE